MNKIRVLVIRPNEKPVVEEHDDTLASMQALVGGLVEQHRIGRGLAILCNEEGKLQNLAMNFYDPFFGAFVGTVVVVRLITTRNGETWGGLTDAEVEGVKLVLT